MSRTAARFNQADIARATRAAIQAGAKGVELRLDGSIFVHLQAPDHRGQSERAPSIQLEEDEIVVL
ncbi:hypothetical protein FNL55_12535 [Tardiphaga sp. vice352]|uniref:hypothetical protein n=1 Tax=Tardiphaga sp. vice352 TaxID=2592816 RepID=UPI0011629CC9|nr:hypothetical protein [Tardiphaga sp. vice352]QDM32065.1 hypothetical protein FNL55_12535 [Tardiphaga sp. vice352]